MPRCYKRRPDARRYAANRMENLEQALEDIKSKKLSLRGAAEKYNIDKMKLHRCITGKHQKKYGGQTVLSTEEEKSLCSKLLTASEWGFPMTSYDVRVIVKYYLGRLGRTVKTFNNNFPGEDWVKGFLKRNNHTLAVRIAENIKRCRAGVTHEIVNEYFNNLEISIKTVKPASVLNYDETNLADDPGRKRVIVKRGCKHPEFILNTSKASTSIMMACAGDGTLLPPFVIYRSLHLWNTWTTGGPKGTRYGNTKSGWIDNKTFEEWFSTIALPYLKKQEPPRALIGDNLSSHLSPHVISECEKNDIKFIFLPKNSTHICQPLDVCFFRPFKRHWREILMNWKMKGNRGCVPKDQFPAMLKQLILKIEPSAASIIKAGFEKCGIIPINRIKILEQIPSEEAGTATNLAMENSLIDILKELRYGKEDNNPTKKKTNLKVKAGKSVANQDSESSESDSGQENIPEQEIIDDSSESKNETISDKSDSEVQLSSTMNISSGKEIVHYNDIIEGDFLLVEMAVATSRKNKKQSYVAQAFKISSTSNESTRSVEVKFLRPHQNTSNTFTWPTVEDCSFIYPHEVKYRLPQPKELRRGLLQFPCDI